MMDVADFQKFLQSITEFSITFDDPHVSLRCAENNLSKEGLIDILLHKGSTLFRIVEDRPQVCKLYYWLGRDTELKIVVDFFAYGKINVRTVKKLSSKFRLGRIQKRRF